MYLFGFQRLQNLDDFFDKFTTDHVLKSFYGRNNSLESQIFGFSNSLVYVLTTD